MLFFVGTPYLAVAVQTCMNWIPIKKKSNLKSNYKSCFIYIDIYYGNIFWNANIWIFYSIWFMSFEELLSSKNIFKPMLHIWKKTGFMNHVFWLFLNLSFLIRKRFYIFFEYFLKSCCESFVLCQIRFVNSFLIHAVCALTLFN